MRKFYFITYIISFLLISACSTAYYETMETFGYHKRDILVDDVEKAMEAQEEAKEQFKTVLEQFSELTGFHGGELQDIYERLSDEYDVSEGKASRVRARIESVENVAEDLFDEWEDELMQYKNDNLRSISERKLKETQRSYGKLIRAMKKAESKIDPVLDAFHDQVLFLKHNLNAQAIASLSSELSNIETDVASLVKDMEASINEANSFITQLKN